MAQAPDVFLGSIGFGLEANTDQLEKSLAVMSRWGREIDRLKAQTSELAQSTARNMAQAERVMGGLFDKVAGATQKLQSLGPRPEVAAAIEKVNTGYQRVVQTVNNLGKELDAQKIARGAIAVNAQIAQSLRMAKDLERSDKLRTDQADALFRAQQKVANMQSQFRVRSATPSFGQEAQAALTAYEAKLRGTVLSTADLRNANRELESTLSRINRQFREGVQLQTQAAAVEARVSRMQNTVASVNRRALTSALPLAQRTEFQQTNTANLNAFVQAVRSSDITAQVQALDRLQRGLNDTRKAINDANGQVSRAALLWKDFERASILAMGPLSGLGARVAVLGSIFQSNNLHIAAGIAVITGAVVAFGLLANKAVQATMELERMEATLTSASGSPILVGDDFKYAAEQANRFGLNIKSVITPYAQFATAARLSGMSLETQRHVFEGVMTAGAALRMDNQKLERTFLALEQMVSKGTVQMQELKLQLGQAIPGAVELAAIAMGKTTAEMFKMMENGELLASDLLPKLATVLKETFGVGAEKGAQSLQAEFNRLSNASFNFFIQLDKATKSSDAVRLAVRALTTMLNSLADNLSTVFGILGAMVGALMGYGGVAGFTALSTAILGAAKAVVVFVREAGTLAAIFAALTPGGRLIATLARIAAALGGAYLGFELMSRATSRAQDDLNAYNKSLEDAIRVHKETGYVHDEVAKRIKEKTAVQIASAQAELASARVTLEAWQAVDKIRNKDKAPEGLGPVTGRTRDGKFVGPQEPIVSPQTAAAQKSVDEMQATLDRLIQLQAEFNSLPVKSFNLTDPLEKEQKAFENFLNRIKKDINDYKQVEREFAATKIDEDAVRISKAIAQAQERIIQMPTKGVNLQKVFDELIKGGFTEVPKNLTDALVEAGFKGGDAIDGLRALLASMYLDMERGKAKIEDQTKALEKFDRLARQEGDMFAKLEARERGARRILGGESPERVRQSERLEEDLAKVRSILTELGISQEGVNQKVEEYKRKWEKITGLERAAEQVKDIRTEWNKLVDSVADSKVDKAWKEYFHGLEVIEEAQKKLGKTEAETAAVRTQLNRNLWKDLWEAANEYGKKFRELMGRLEESFLDTFTDIVFGGESTWKQMLKSMEKEIFAFVTRMLVVKPLMTYLFGDLYSSKGSPATGSMGVVGSIAQGMGFDLKNILGIGVPTQPAAPVFENGVMISPPGGNGLESTATGLFGSLFNGGGGGFFDMLGSIFGGGSAGGGIGLMLAAGGKVTGEGGPTSDSILARLSNGEFVVNADSTRKYEKLLHAINEDMIPKFAVGGMAGSPIPKLGMSEIPRLGNPVSRAPQSMAAIKAQPATQVVHQHNTFVIQGAIDKRTQQQIASRTGASAQRALQRNS